MSAPIAPTSVSASTPGPLVAALRLEDRVATRDMAVTPAGVAAFSAARAFSIGGKLENVGFPVG